MDNNLGVNSTIFDDAWSPTNTNGAYPIPTPTYAYGNLTYQSDFYLAKSDYTRLKNVSLSYNIDGNILNSLNLDGATVFARGNNLGILKSANSNVDPDGIYGSYLIKSWQCGIKLTF